MAGKSSVDIKDLDLWHRQRYRDQYRVSAQIQNPSLRKTEAGLRNYSQPCSDLESFLLQQNKSLIACSSNPAHIGYYIVNKWMQEHPYMRQFDWLILLKADQLRQGLDTAICEEILQCYEGYKRQSVNYDDITQNIKEASNMVIIEGNVDEIPERFTKDSKQYEYVIFCVKENTDLHTEVLEKWNQSTTFHFDFSSTQQFDALEERMKGLAIGSHKPSTQVLEDLLDRLSEIQDWPVGIEGMYVEDGNIVVDVSEGSKDNIEQHLLQEAEVIFTGAGFDPKKIVHFMEQEDGLGYCVHRGGTICNVDEGNVLEQILYSGKIKGVACLDEIRKDDRPGYGTVACVTEFENQDSASSERPLEKGLCVLTSRHIFVKDLKKNIDSKSKLEGNYFGENDDAFDRIAKESYGILGNIDMKGVDISVIPVQPNDVRHSTIDQPVPMIYRGTSESLLDKKVEKLGATIKERVPGIVVKTGYRAMIGAHLCKDCILVVASDDAKPDVFCQQGDSGSLVITHVDSHFEIVGMVTKGSGKWKNMAGLEQQAAIVVLMKNCFEAIEKEFNIKLRLCELWENCSVKPIGSN